MNERIFELAKQAGFIEEDGGDNLHVFDGYEAITCTEELKKFAELLIRECLLTISKTPNLFTDEEVAVMVNCHNYVERHFGVES